MRAVILTILLVASTFAIRHPVNHQIVNEIRKAQTSWTPMDPELNPFAYMSIEEIKGMMGTKIAITGMKFFKISKTVIVICLYLLNLK